MGSLVVDHRIWIWWNLFNGLWWCYKQNLRLQTILIKGNINHVISILLKFEFGFLHNLKRMQMSYKVCCYKITAIFSTAFIFLEIFLILVVLIIPNSVLGKAKGLKKIAILLWFRIVFRNPHHFQLVTIFYKNGLEIVGIFSLEVINTF